MFSFTYRIAATEVPCIVNFLSGLVDTMWEQIIGWSSMIWLVGAIVCFILFAIELFRIRGDNSKDIDKVAKQRDELAGFKSTASILVGLGIVASLMICIAALKGSKRHGLERTAKETQKGQKGGKTQYK